MMVDPLFYTYLLNTELIIYLTRVDFPTFFHPHTKITGGLSGVGFSIEFMTACLTL